MTLKDLKVIYDREHSQAGDTEQDFYEWAVNYLLKQTNYNQEDLKELKNEINRHLKGFEKAIEKIFGKE
jgi:DNA-directed RNA polymerase subunit F